MRAATLLPHLPHLRAAPRAFRCCAQTMQTNYVNPNHASGGSEKIKKELVIEGVWRRFNWGLSTGAGCCCHLQRSRQPVACGSGDPGAPASADPGFRCHLGKIRSIGGLPTLPHTPANPLFFSTISSSASDGIQGLAKK